MFLLANDVDNVNERKVERYTFDGKEMWRVRLPRIDDESPDHPSIQLLRSSTFSQPISLKRHTTMSQHVRLILENSACISIYYHNTDPSTSLSDISIYKQSSTIYSNTLAARAV